MYVSQIRIVKPTAPHILFPLDLAWLKQGNAYKAGCIVLCARKFFKLQGSGIPHAESLNHNQRNTKLLWKPTNKHQVFPSYILPSSSPRDENILFHVAMITQWMSDHALVFLDFSYGKIDLKFHSDRNLKKSWTVWKLNCLKLMEHSSSTIITYLAFMYAWGLAAAFRAEIIYWLIS